MSSRREGGRGLGMLVTGAFAGAAVTLLALRFSGLLVPLNLAGTAYHKFISAYEAIYQQYYQPVASNTLMNGAVEGMVNSLNDPFSDYFAPTDETAFQNTLANAYVGIGAVVQEQGGYLTIQSLVANSPAAKAGMKPNDVIISVNGKSIHGMSSDEAIGLIMGPAGKSVEVTIRRPSEGDKRIAFHMKRARVTAPEVYPKMMANHIGYIRFSIVGQNAATEIKSAITQLQKQGATRLILDMRGNPGGYLDQAIAIANELIPKGEVIVQVKPRTGDAQKTESSGPGLKMPIVVIMDQGTASAAEILSAALHDDVGAPLVGTRSYGKGTAQTEAVYSDGSGIKYTVDKWLTPSGQWINKVGIQPTVHVNLPSFAALPTLQAQSLPLRQNQVSSEIATLQKTLRALGYRVDRTDGYYDSSTVNAVSQFQRANQLTVSGSVDASTATQLNIKLQGKISSDDTQLKAAVQQALRIPVASR